MPTEKDDSPAPFDRDLMIKIIDESRTYTDERREAKKSSDRRDEAVVRKLAEGYVRR